MLLQFLVPCLIIVIVQPSIAHSQWSLDPLPLSSYSFSTIAPPPLPPATVVATLNIFLSPTSSFPLTSIPSSFARRYHLAPFFKSAISHRCSTTITFTPCRYCYHPHLLPTTAAVVATAFLYRKDLSLPSLPPTTMHNPLSCTPTATAICHNAASSLSLPSPFFHACYLHDVASLYRNDILLPSLSQHCHFPCFSLPSSSFVNR
ncbi:hypothetical protein BHE74_00033600 [Ensete ventricosum]|nr:hypothetical protein BHE74_00033600 [Ensete ventricosum]